jgi:hypothetical protein
LQGTTARVCSESADKQTSSEENKQMEETEEETMTGGSEDKWIDIYITRGRPAPATVERRKTLMNDIHINR